MIPAASTRPTRERRFIDVHELRFHELPIPLDRDRFVRELLRDLVAAMSESLGVEAAADFVSDIGERTGHQFRRWKLHVDCASA